MNPIEQQFFNDLEKKWWTSADKLGSLLDATPVGADGRPDHGLLARILKRVIAVARRQVVFE